MADTDSTVSELTSKVETVTLGEDEKKLVPEPEELARLEDSFSFVDETDVAKLKAEKEAKEAEGTKITDKGPRKHHIFGSKPNKPVAVVGNLKNIPVEELAAHYGQREKIDLDLGSEKGASNVDDDGLSSEPIESIEWLVVREVGRGSSGTVSLVKDTNNELYVRKIINLDKLKPSHIKHAMAEVSVLAALDHPNVIRHRESYMQGVDLNIIMEYANDGDLDIKIQKQRKAGQYFTEKRCLSVFVQMCAALKHVHDRKVIHRDLKPKNFFVHRPCVIKMGDFGFTAVLKQTQGLVNTRLGTPYFMAPELCEGKPYSYKVDVWALGCTLYKLCTFKYPFNMETWSGLSESICSDPHPTLPDVFSPTMQSIVDAMLQKEPDSRPSVDQLFREFPVLRKIAKKTLPAEVYTRDFRSNGKRSVTRTESPPMMASERAFEVLRGQYLGLKAEKGGEAVEDLEAFRGKYLATSQQQ